MPREIGLKVMTKTVQASPPNAVHWSGSQIAEALELSASSAGRVWAGADLKADALVLAAALS